MKKEAPKRKKKATEKATSKSADKDIRKFAGMLKSDIDPVEYQKQMRNEWK